MPTSHNYYFTQGNAKCDSVVSSALQKLSGLGDSSEVKFSRCERCNVSVCSVSQSESKFTMLMYNSMGQSRRDYVRVPVTSSSYSVYDDAGVAIPSQTIAVNRDAAVGQDAARFTLVFEVDVPALGYSTYSAQQTHEAASSSSTFVQPEPLPDVTGDDIIVANSKLKLTFSGSTGRLETIENLVDGAVVTVDQKWM